VEAQEILKHRAPAGHSASDAADAKPEDNAEKERPSAKRSDGTERRFTKL
jgi:hypothetical protein